MSDPTNGDGRFVKFVLSICTVLIAVGVVGVWTMLGDVIGIQKDQEYAQRERTRMSGEIKENRALIMQGFEKIDERLDRIEKKER